MIRRLRFLKERVVKSQYASAKRPEMKSMRGFTLIELLVVVAILALLAGVVGPQVMKRLAESKSKTAKVQVEDLSTALDLLRLDVGRYPSTDEGLQALVEQPADMNAWNGPYLRKKKLPKDPWSYDYHYRSPGEHGKFDVYTLGADNTEGGEDEDRDVVSWE